ncbi:hypothetical protein HS096_02615 [candidate division WWE3 bacterium]|uniref:Fibronectin type-III domain-containing protein n=1 Tax=candidate division WWE3 bacterium TaxID=2053526 RepID=A0A928TS14_UNCKA|nr:hypothetical protein [candidate division WWE3 bacterium]
MMKILLEKIGHLARFMVAALAAGFFIYGSLAIAAPLVQVSDTISDALASNPSNHTISFITPTGVDASSDTITATFATGFDLSSILVGDIDLSHGTGTGFETSETLAGAAGAGVWGVGISGQVITFTAPTDAAGGEIVASSTVKILIGTNAAGGVNRIVNPTSTGSYQISIAGTFGDTGEAGVAIVDSDQVSVTAEVQAPAAPGQPSGSGGGPPADITPPLIFNVQATSTSFTTAKITWQTDESSTSIVDYGHTAAYASGTANNASLVLAHQIDLTGLLSCQTYVFRVTSADQLGNTAMSGGYSFIMPCDTTPPVISNVQALNITDSSAVLTWNTDEPATSVAEFGLTNAYGNQASALGLVTGHALPIAGLQPGTTYHFRVLSADAYGNASVSSDFTFTTLSDTTPPTNVTLTATAGDAQVVLEWTLPTDPDFAGTRIVRKTGGFPTGPFDGTLVYAGPGTSHTDSGLTNDTAYYYGAYAYDTNANYASGALAQATPQALPLPPPTPTPTSPPPVVPPPVLPPPVLPPPVIGGVTTTPPTPGATMEVLLFGAGGTLPLVADSRGYIVIPAHSSILVVVPVSSMNGAPEQVAFVVFSPDTYSLSYDPGTNSYRATIPAPEELGLHQAKGQAVFADGRVAEDALQLFVLSAGSVYERPLIGAPSTPVPDATITLFQRVGGTWVPWSGAQYGQSNPTLSGSDGGYVYEVPPGEYYVRVEKEGFETFEGAPSFIDSNVFAQHITLIKIPPTPEEVVEGLATATPIVAAVEVIQNLGQQAAYRIEQLQQILESPAVQSANKTILAPAVATVAVLNAASAISLLNLLSYLQYLFTQPLLFFWRRKRKKFGVVYNSLTKRPVDLAIVRLIHAETGLTVNTKVTDKLGRYVMYVQPGRYRIEAVKPNYVFPSQYMKGRSVDIDFVDLYYGNDIRADEASTLTLNVPLDPVVPEETPRQVILKSFLRKVQHAVAFSGVLLSLVALLITPTVPFALLVLAQAAIYLLFRRLSLPPKPKSWGIVYDQKTKKPLAQAIVRIFDSKFNKLLETQLTDAKGRYGFLVGKSVYYLMSEARNYARTRLPDIDLTAKAEGIVEQDIALMRQDTGAHAPLAPQNIATGSTATTPPASTKAGIRTSAGSGPGMPSVDTASGLSSSMGAEAEKLARPESDTGSIPKNPSQPNNRN